MNFKTLLTDLRVALSAVLAGQAVLLDSLTSLGVPAKLVSSALGALGVVLTVVQLVGEAQAPAGTVTVTLPPVPPAPTGTSGNVKP